MIKISEDTEALIYNLNNQLKKNCTDLLLYIGPYGRDIFKLCLLLKNNLLNKYECVSQLIINDNNNYFTPLDI